MELIHRTSRTADMLTCNSSACVPLVQVVELVRNSGVSVTFQTLDQASYIQAKAQGVNLSGPHNTPVSNGGAKHTPKPKLCYIIKSSSGSSYGFSLRSVTGELRRQRRGVKSKPDML